MALHSAPQQRGVMRAHLQRKLRGKHRSLWAAHRRKAGAGLPCHGQNAGLWCDAVQRGGGNQPICQPLVRVAGLYPAGGHCMGRALRGYLPLLLGSCNAAEEPSRVGRRIRRWSCFKREQRGERHAVQLFAVCLILSGKMLWGRNPMQARLVFTSCARWSAALVGSADIHFSERKDPFDRLCCFQIGEPMLRAFRIFDRSHFYNRQSERAVCCGSHVPLRNGRGRLFPKTVGIFII